MLNYQQRSKYYKYLIFQFGGETTNKLWKTGLSQPEIKMLQNYFIFFSSHFTQKEQLE